MHKEPAQSQLAESDVLLVLLGLETEAVARSNQTLYVDLVELYSYTFPLETFHILPLISYTLSSFFLIFSTFPATFHGFSWYKALTSQQLRAPPTC